MSSMISTEFELGKVCAWLLLIFHNDVMSSFPPHCSTRPLLFGTTSGGTVRARVGLTSIHDTVAVGQRSNTSIVPAVDRLRARESLDRNCVPFAAVVMAAVEKHCVVGAYIEQGARRFSGGELRRDVAIGKWS